MKRFVALVFVVFSLAAQKQAQAQSGLFNFFQNAQRAITEPEKRQVLLPTVIAATDCIAQWTLKHPNIVDAYRSQNIQPVLDAVWSQCSTELTRLKNEHDRLHGYGTGVTFIEGPYKDDLPRAVLTRIKQELDNRLAEAEAEAAKRRAEADNAQRSADVLRNPPNWASTRQAVPFSSGTVLPGVRPAPVPPPPIGAGATTAPYEMEPPVKPVAPQMSQTLTPEEIRGWNFIYRHPGDAEFAALAKPLIQYGQQKRQADYARQIEEYRSDLALYRQRQIAYEEFQRDREKRRLELPKQVVPPPTARNKVTSTGTGFFVSEIGHIVTNAHVVDGCQTVRSSRGGAVRKVSTDEVSDLALYVASEKPSAVARLRGGRGARAGEPVVAVGFPLSGLLSSDPIVTTGIISALSGLRNDRRTIQVTAPVRGKHWA
jgi:S1-C subfamily serine protease